MPGVIDVASQSTKLFYGLVRPAKAATFYMRVPLAIHQQHAAHALLSRTALVTSK